MFKKAFIPIATAVFSLMVSINATAVQPVIEREQGELSDWPSFVCDGFEIWGNFEYTLTFIDYYDDDGNLVKETLHQRIFNTIFFNSVNPEIMHELKSDVAFAEWSYEDGILVEYRERGVFYHFMDGGEKIIFVSGIGIWNADDGYFHNGQFIYPAGEEGLARLCAHFTE